MTTIETPHPSVEQIRCAADRAAFVLARHDDVLRQLDATVKVIADYELAAMSDHPTAVASTGIIAMQGMDLLASVAADLRHALAEVADAHAHNVAACNAATAAERRAILAEDELARLRGAS